MSEARPQRPNEGEGERALSGLDASAFAAALRGERYARSLRTARPAGAAALRGEIETPEGREAKEALRADWESSLGEMLQTYEELRHDFEVLHMRRSRINEAGHAMNDKGEELVGIYALGAAVSARDAQTNQIMLPQAKRDAINVLNAQRDDAMPVGTLRKTVSIEPKKAMEQNPTFWNDMGYRRGLAFTQWSYKADAQTIWHGSYSVDYSDVALWRDIFAEHGLELPDDVTTDDFHAHGLEEQVADIEEANQNVLAFRSRYYQKNGLPAPKYNVQEFLAANKATIDHAFEKLYMPWAKALAAGEFNNTMRDFVWGLLQDTRAFDENMRDGLLRLAHSDAFDEDSARLLETAIRYGTVVGLLLDEMKSFAGNRGKANLPAHSQTVTVETVAMLAARVAGGVIAGTHAGLTFGGCSPGLHTRNKKSRTNFLTTLQDLLDAVNADDDHEEIYEFNVEDYCRDCQPRPRENERKKMCGPCKLCRDCDAKRKLDFAAAKLAARAAEY